MLYYIQEGVNYEIKNKINDDMFVYDINSAFTDLPDIFNSRKVYGKA